MRFYPQQGKGQALALPGALALGREGRREALVTSTLVEGEGDGELDDEVDIEEVLKQDGLEDVEQV